MTRPTGTRKTVSLRLRGILVSRLLPPTLSQSRERILPRSISRIPMLHVVRRRLRLPV
jgi:hypothetical protein